MNTDDQKWNKSRQEEMGLMAHAIPDRGEYLCNGSYWALVDWAGPQKRVDGGAP